MTIGMDQLHKVANKCCCLLARSPKGRIQGGAKIVHAGPLLQRTSSGQKATTTNRMHSIDLEAFENKCC